MVDVARDCGVGAGGYLGAKWRGRALVVHGSYLWHGHDRRGWGLGT